MKAFVPDLAMVPKLLIRSALKSKQMKLDKMKLFWAKNDVMKRALVMHSKFNSKQDFNYTSYFVRFTAGRQLHIFFTQAKTWHLIVDLAKFAWIPLFKHDVIIKLFCFDLQNKITSCKNWRIQGNSAKSNNPMSSFGLIEEIMELSHTD